MIVETNCQTSFFQSKTFIWPNIDLKRFKSVETAEKQAIRPNSKKKKCMSKTRKNTQNRLETIFMTKDQKVCVFE